MVSRARDIFPGIESGILCISSSTEYDPSHSPERCRIGYQIREGGACWKAATSDTNQYLQLSSPILHSWHQITTAGRLDEDQWVTSYKISYTVNGKDWVNYNKSQILRGNYDRSTLVSNELSPFIARAVRIKPISYNNHICLRAEFYISENLQCIENLSSNYLIPAVELGLPVSVSSVYTPSYNQSRIRINFNGNREGGSSWTAAHSDINQWVGVSSVIRSLWCKISMQGDVISGQWVTEVMLSYTEDGLNWHLYEEGKIFKACENGFSIRNIDLKETVAKAIRIHPLAWNRGISMRIECYFKQIHDLD